MTSPIYRDQPGNTSDSSKDSAAKDKPDNVGLPMSLIKALREKTGNHSSEGGSNSSNGGSVNHSDNSALVSLGNTSFGFNFDSEEAMLNNSAIGESDAEGLSDGKDSTKPASKAPKKKHPKAVSSRPDGNEKKTKQAGQKRKVPEKFENDSSGGYNTDDEGPNAKPAKVASANKAASINAATVAKIEDDSTASKPKKKKVEKSKREERNAREKERSFRISRQINDLRNLLSNGGVIVPKGTKSSVLTEAANYIRMLQQHQYRSEIDRNQLIQQLQMIGGGALGDKAASVIRHVAAQNGVWSLGNFGGVPPKSAMSSYPPGQEVALPGQAGAEDGSQQSAQGPLLQIHIEDHEYRYIFNSCSVGMAIASMGGAFIDCNMLFCQLSNYTKQEVCSMTIFNVTCRDDLQPAFDLISQMISPPMEGSDQGSPKSCVLRGSMKHRSDLGLSVSLIKGNDGVAKCFCVTLIKNPSSPYDISKPVPATLDMVRMPSGMPPKDGGSGALDSSPAYTTG